MASFNKIVLLGNLTKDPELKQVGMGQVCRLSMAVNRQYKNRQTNTMVQEVCYVDVDVWGPQAEACRQYLQKGRQAMIEGRLKQDVWKDNDGQTRSKHSIVADRVIFLGGGANSQAGDDAEDMSMPGASHSRPNNGSQFDSSFKDEAPFEDDLPF